MSALAYCGQLRTTSGWPRYPEAPFLAHSKYAENILGRSTQTVAILQTICSTCGQTGRQGFAELADLGWLADYAIDVSETSPSAIKRCPHPVRRITAVDWEALFTKLATFLPSMRGMPKSVMTTAKGFPCL
jgi:hypothetical protein